MEIPTIEDLGNHVCFWDWKEKKFVEKGEFLAYSSLVNEDYFKEEERNEINRVKELPNVQMATLLEAEGQLYISKGIHWVNRLGYIACKVEDGYQLEEDYLY